MDDRQLKETLARAFPDTPAGFHHRLACTAERIRKENEKMKVKTALRLALICALALGITGGALAAMNHYGVFNFNSYRQGDYYFTLPGAEDMIQYDLCEARAGDLLWRVKEAAYDGRVLRILYSVRDPLAPAPLTGEDVYAAYGELCAQGGAWLECDGTGEIFVNDVGVDLLNVDLRFGQENGEIEGWIDCRLTSFATGEALLPEGEITVSMPLRFPNEDIRAASDQGLSFSLTVGDAASRYAVPCPAPSNPQKGVTVRFTDLHFSPVTVSVDLEVDVSPEAMPFLDGPLDDEKLDEIAAAYFPAYYFFDFHLENSRGEALGPFREGMIRLIAREGGGITFLIHQEFAPSDRYTDTVYLVREDERLAIPLNPVNR